MGRTVGLESAAKDFDGGRFDEPVAGNGFGRHGEGELNPITGLLRGEIRDGDRDRRSRRRGFAGGATTGSEQEDEKRKAKLETWAGARFELHCSIFRRR